MTVQHLKVSLNLFVPPILAISNLLSKINGVLRRYSRRPLLISFTCNSLWMPCDILDALYLISFRSLSITLCDLTYVYLHLQELVRAACVHWAWSSRRPMCLRETPWCTEEIFSTPFTLYLAGRSRFLRTTSSWPFSVTKGKDGICVSILASSGKCVLLAFSK